MYVAQLGQGQVSVTCQKHAMQSALVQLQTAWDMPGGYAHCRPETQEYRDCSILSVN